ncbi:MAG: hypothetical protein DRJ37_06780 [Thermoprotei archaeon]|nr:MAG: hypothetical protein DRJ37_06780 [Thermoprotei archaeon]
MGYFMPLFKPKDKVKWKVPKEVILRSRIVKAEGIEWEYNERGEVVIKVKLDRKDKSLMSGLVKLPKEKKIMLDEVGTFVWEQIERGITVERLIEKLAEKYDLHWKEAETSLLTFLSMLISRGLIKLEPAKQSALSDRV